jgi:hypothetical protein
LSLSLSGFVARRERLVVYDTKIGWLVSSKIPPHQPVFLDSLLHSHSFFMLI